ncbi:MAG: hemagglutinin repeat-containing protein, partial [Comamonas sp.]|uniref:hemagglutinin repeat-containing protein n=1 Tax=Comamonas sp. TaxID=34028 RepID=UPI002FC5931D
TGALHSDLGVVQAAQHLDIDTHGQALTNTGTLLALGHATIDAAHVNNTTGTISAAEALTLTSSSLDNTFGDIGAASIAINTPKGALTNDGGNIIASKGNLNLKSAALRNEKGRLQAARDLYLDSQGQRLTNTGKLLAFGQAVINAGDVINTTGTISAAKALTLTSTSLDNTAGAIGAAAIVLDVQEGPLTNGEKGKIIASEGGLSVQGRALYNGDGRLQAAQDLTIDTHGQAFTSTGTLLSLGKATIDAGIVDNTGGTISAADALTLTSTSLDNTSGQICAASIAINTQRGTLINKASGKIIASNGELNVQSGALNNDQGLLQAAQALTVNTHGHGIANTNTGTLRGFQANIDAGPVNNAGGGIAAATTLDLKSSALDNRAGRINAASAAIDTRKGMLHNDAGHIVTSTGTLDVKSGVFHNGSGMVHAAQDLEIRTHDEALNNSGTMRAQGNARIRAGTLDNTGGHLLAGGPDTADAELTVTATGHVNNSAGHMLARGNLTLTAPALNNSQGEIGAGGKLDARIAAAVINSGGQLVGDAEAVLNSANLQNDEQAVISSSAGPVNITTGALSNYRSSITARHATSITSQGLDNTQGTISGDSLTIDTQGQQLINADAKLLASGSSLRIDSGHLDNRRGRISAQQDAVLTAQGIHNGAGGISAPTLQVRSQDTSGNWALVDNQSGSMMADQHLQIDSGALNNTAGAIKTTRADSRLMLDGHGADITNHQSGEDGGIVSAGALEVNAHQGMVRNSRGGIMGAAGDAEINAERIENQGGVMASHSRLQITSNANTGTGIDNSEGGLLQSLGDVKLYAGDAAIMNTRGSIRANNGVLVQSRGHVENALGNIKAGKQLSILDAHVASGAPLSSAQQTLHNRGGTLSSGKDLAIRTKEFSGASGLQSQGDMQLEIAADHTNQGDMDIGGHLGITLGGNLSNQGVIRGGKGVAVSASNIDNQSGAEISSAGLMKVNARQVLTNRGVFTGGDAQINARVLDNPGEGLIVGDHLSIAADRIDNRAEGEKSGSIMARKLLEIGAAVVKNQHGASIRSDGDIRIGSSLDENRVASGASSVSNHGALIDARGSVDFFSGAVHNTNAGVKVVKDEFVGSYPAGNLVQVEGRMPESDDQYQVHPHGILIPFYSTKQRIGELGFPEGMSAGGMFKITHPGRFLKNIPLACTPVKVENNYDDSCHLKYVYESANSMRFAEYGIEKPENYNPIEPLPGNFGATLSGKEVYWGPSSNMAGFEAALIVYEKSVQAAKDLNNVILEKIKNNNKVEGFWRDYKKIVNVRSEIFRDRVESSKPAKINAGRNITAAGEFYNVDSIVVANGVVFIPHQKNHSTKGVETTKTIGSPISYHWKSKRGGKVKQGSKKHYEVATPGQPTEQLSRITFDLPTGIYQQGHIGGATTSYAIPTKNAGKNTAFGRVEASPVVRISQGSESAAAEQGSAATKMGSLVLNGLPWADVDQHFHSPGVNVQPAQTAHPVPVEQPPQIGQSASPLRPQSASDLPIGTCGMTSVAAANIIHSGFTGTARMDVNGQELSGVTFLDVQPHSVHVAAENVVPTPATQAAGGAMPSSIGVPVADGMLLPPAQGIDATAHQMPNIAMAAPAFPEMSARAPAEVSEPAVTAAAGTALEVRTTALPQYLPVDSLYIINAHHPDKPLIETHPAVTNRKSWMSSDFMLDALSMDPALLQKRLGDGYYEQQLIQQQVGQLTGRRYLGHYTNDDEQYHALLQNGVTVAQDYKLRPGIALNAEQVAQLTSDLVWLVHEDITLSDGTVQTVLVPKVYVVAKVGDLETSGALISGDTVYSQSRENFHNSGTIAGRRAVVIEAHDINNIGGRIVGESVALLAERDINVVGGTVSAALSLMAKAGNDMNMATTTSTNRGGDDANGCANTNVDRIAALILEPVDAVDVPPAQRSLVLEAGRNANLQAALIANAVEGASTYIHAAKDVVLSTVNISNEQRITWDPRNLLSFGQSEEMGTEIRTLGPTRIEAGENFDARAAQVHSSNALEIKAVQDAKIAAGEASQSVDSRSYSKSKGLFSSSTSTRINQRDSTQSLASSLSGDTVSITSHQDITVLGSNVGSQHGTMFKAERDINILADSETTSETNFHKTTKSGLIGGGGPGLTFGSQRQSTDRTGASITFAASTVASIDG